MNQEPQEELYQMLAELRRRQLVACKADNAVLQQHLAIWNQYQVYVINERNKLAKKTEPAEPSAPTHAVEPVNGDGRMPNSMIEAVDRAVNGDSLSIAQVVLAVEARFPKIEVHPKAAYRALWTLMQRGKFTRTKSGKKFIYARAMWLLLLLPILFGCRTAQRTPETIPAAIMPHMPRRMPDAPRPADVVVKAPTTRSYALSWTHDPSPGLLTYRVDYGLSNTPLTNSLMTSANNCTIRRLALDRTYTFRVVGCDGRKYSELENLHLIIK